MLEFQGIHSPFPPGGHPVVLEPLQLSLLGSLGTSQIPRLHLEWESVGSWVVVTLPMGCLRGVIILVPGLTSHCFLGFFFAVPGHHGLLSLQQVNDERASLMCFWCHHTVDLWGTSCQEDRAFLIPAFLSCGASILFSYLSSCFLVPKCGSAPHCWRIRFWGAYFKL